MLAKSNTLQQNPPRRTPLSLSTSAKPTTKNEKNDNNKKDTTNNQKTENLKKDSHQERKLSSDKKQSSTESKRSSSTSSTDSRKVDDTKINKNDDNKKSQNGVNGNGIKDKQSNSSNNGNEVAAKTKPEPPSNGNSSKKDSQKSVEKKKEPVVTDVAPKNDNKEKTTEKTKEAKNEENKNKSAEKTKEKKTVEVSNTQALEQEKTKEKKENVKVTEKKKTDEKVEEEKNVAIETPEKTPVKETIIVEQEAIMVDLPKDEDQSKKAEETSTMKTPTKGNKVEETHFTEIPLPETMFEDIEMMEPLTVAEEEPTSCSIFAVSTPSKNCSPKEALNLFDVPTNRSPKSEIKPPKETLTHTPDRKSCPRTFSSISGRRSIRPIGDYTFSGNLQIRESYRKINTELDFTSSSLNVTVGSEVPNNESFSFFSRSRKRDRSSPTHQSAEMQTDLSPKSPKRAKIDTGMYGFFNAMASPITMLRARLARASVQSTPKKQIINQIEQEIVENVSAIAVEGTTTVAVDEDLTATEEQTFNPDSTVADNIEQPEEEPAKCAQTTPEVVVEDVDDIKIKETITATDSQAKKKCSIM
ncbi:uncharacterized protein DDB_G0288805 [Episyrphus balteatus]|uniref:uncharacterized protein DDB_G0288805 n=1 Tax=Episyrphus balteatus TaxID=286459 RepID=UPI002484DEB1|nr:uncharacterized protein DDB_G0288805 [Episyrphus balteatus]XP_055847721.1 uncharacterized protein DDB_G0288805 [Episyrphus balteatus]